MTKSKRTEVTVKLPTYIVEGLDFWLAKFGIKHRKTLIEQILAEWLYTIKAKREENGKKTRTDDSRFDSISKAYPRRVRRSSVGITNEPDRTGPDDSRTVVGHPQKRE